ncbi:MAG: Holliday junction branch migration protein RuvA [Bacteroidales bacterium]|nr:Holliday junction branch migration protein RuvA [Bacteroidales bacterium]
MYDYIKGELIETTPTQAVVECGGMGYRLEISLQTFSDIQNAKQVKLYIYYYVKEDIAMWYGFNSKEERGMFLMLINVNGVGPNTARMILSSLTTEELRNAIISDDVNRIKAVKGIGLKSAQKIIIELKDKIIKGGDSSTLPLGAGAKTPVGAEAVGALVMLGFTKQQSEKAVGEVLKEHPESSVEQVIKFALKRM